MTVDYNLVILGGSLAARYAAARASCFQARVALIEPYSFQASYSGVDLDVAIAQLLQAQAQQRVVSSLGGGNSPNEKPEKPSLSSIPRSSSCPPRVLGEGHPPTDYPPFAQLLRELSLDALTAQGVDVIIGGGDCETGEFCRRPHFGVAVNGRLLRSHAYLLAPISRPILPPIPGLSTVPYWTVETLWGRSLPQATRIAIIGETPRSIELAQALATSGMAITLLIEHPRFLHHEGREVAQWALAKLESLGVDVRTGAKLTHVKSVDATVMLRLEKQSVVADYLLVATPRQANLSLLNLEAASIRAENGRVNVSQTLRTAHPRIYACGEAVAPLDAPAVARYQAECAVKNALFWPTRRWGDRPLTTLIRTDPLCGHVGLTDAQANHRFNRNVINLAIPLQTERPVAPPSSLWRHSEGSFLSVIVHHCGAIVGAHCVGRGAEELLSIFAIAIDQGWSVEQLLSLPASIFRGATAGTSGLCADVLQRLLLKWESERRNVHPRRRNVLEILMNWQRDWSRR